MKDFDNYQLFKRIIKKKERKKMKKKFFAEFFNLTVLIKQYYLSNIIF